MPRIYTPLAPFAAVASPTWRAWRRAASRVASGVARLSASRAALMQGSIRLSRWAYLCCLVASAVVTLLLFTLVDLARLTSELRVEERQLLAQLESLNQTMRTEFDAIAASPTPALSGEACSAAMREQLVRASLFSSYARAFYVRRPSDALWCGPLGARPFYGAAALSGAATAVTPRLNLVRGTRLGGTSLVALRHASGQLMAAELDPRFLTTLLGTTGAWDRALYSDGTARVTWLGRDRADHGSYRVVERTVTAPTHGIVLVQTITLDHLVARALRNMPLALTAMLLLAFVAGAVVNRLVLNRASPQHRLWLALRKRRFEPLVQPIVDVASGRCVGGEVLMRWEHPVRGLLAPSEFLQLAEETGMIVPMSDLVMIKARDRLAPLTTRHPDLYFSFNIIPAQLRDPAFAERLGQIFDDISLRRQHLLLELTEREFVDDGSSRALQALRTAGYRLAIDDFGTGHSSLATLETLPLDRLKIDREFVRTIDDDTVTRPVLDSIIALAHSLGIAIIAEGVETQTQWDYLAARGVQYVQGFLVARPMPTKEFERWLDARQDGVERTGEFAMAAAVAGSGSAHVSAHVSAPADAGEFVTTPQHNAAWGSAEGDAAQRLGALDPERLVSDMRGVAGLEVRDRMHALMRYPQCFVASEAVDWLSEQLQISRRSAVRVGQRLVALGHIRHVLDEHDFSDGHLFFRFTESATSIPPSADGMNLPELTHVLRAMRGVSGVRARTRLHALVRYEDCFSGREACAWLMSHFKVSRAIALWLGREMMKSGGLRHVFDDRPFTDSDELYRFV